VRALFEAHQRWEAAALQAASDRLDSLGARTATAIEQATAVHTVTLAVYRQAGAARLDRLAALHLMWWRRHELALQFRRWHRHAARNGRAAVAHGAAQLAQRRAAATLRAWHSWAGVQRRAATQRRRAQWWAAGVGLGLRQRCE
jgi:hypothetical protein